MDLALPAMPLVPRLWRVPFKGTLQGTPLSEPRILRVSFKGTLKGTQDFRVPFKGTLKGAVKGLVA